MDIIKNVKLDQERALYATRDLIVDEVKFDGILDGESALKECANIEVTNCFCNLRYPFWHNDNLKILNTKMTENCRAALWYSKNVSVSDTQMHGIKALRECTNVKIFNCSIISSEFGWSTHKISMTDCTAISEYFMMRSSELTFKNVNFKGKYSFQYIKNGEFFNCNFDTKDAFWHGENIYIKDSVLKGEYFAWYSNGLTLDNCTIIGTQPFCYCNNLKLINCKMIDTDLAFEKSNVEADVITNVLSIKNPYSGYIKVPSVGEIILDDDNAKCKITLG